MANRYRNQVYIIYIKKKTGTDISVKIANYPTLLVSFNIVNNNYYSSPKHFVRAIY